MIHGYPWYYWFGLFVVFTIGVGIFCDGIGQGWIRKLRRKPKPVKGRHGDSGEFEMVTIRDERIGVSYTVMQRVTPVEEKPVPVAPQTVSMEAVHPDDRPDWVNRYIDEHYGR